MLRDLVNANAKSLSIIFKKSLGNFHNDQKQASTAPVFKKGKKGIHNRTPSQLA